MAVSDPELARLRQRCVLGTPLKLCTSSSFMSGFRIEALERHVEAAENAKRAVEQEKATAFAELSEARFLSGCLLSCCNWFLTVVQSSSCVTHKAGAVTGTLSGLTVTKTDHDACSVMSG